MPETPSRAQRFFDRVMRTWLLPEGTRRVERGEISAPIHLRAALLVWPKPAAEPDIFLNDEVRGRVRKARVIASHAVTKGDPVGPEDFRGLPEAILDGSLKHRPFLLVMQGRGNRYYACGRHLERVPALELKPALMGPLNVEGLGLLTPEHSLPVLLDSTPNVYRGTPAQKRRWRRTLEKQAAERFDATLRHRVSRQLKLPAIFILSDDEVTPLVQETREAYVDGLFFSSIAAAATAADRVCIVLAREHGFTDAEVRSVCNLTFGQKVGRLRSRGVIDVPQEKVLARLNRVRNRFLHPRHRISDLATKRAALTAVRLLNEFVESTHGALRDFEFEEGRLVPRRFSTTA